MPHSQTIRRAMAVAPLDVAARAVGDVAKNNFLRDAAAHADGETGEQLVLAIGVFVFLRQPHREPSDGPRGMMVTLCSGSVCGSKLEQQRVAGFVISGVRFSFSLKARLRRSLPQRTLSRASSSSASVIPF
jgi:sugar (pentulose or hexulose) kinase